MTGRLARLAAALVVAAACTPGSPPPDRAPPSPGPRATASPARARWLRAACSLPRPHVERLARGHYPGRSPDVTLVPRFPNMFATFAVTTHSGPWDYLQRVPLVLYGPGYVRARGTLRARREVTLADIAPTLAELLGFRMPPGLPGRPVSAALVPRERRPGPPRAVVLVVWDGGGWNVLRRWPHAWPTLARLMREGASVAGATVGSSPSVTPAVHATIGTGAFPDRHGIVSIPLRSGDAIVGSYEGNEARRLELPTLADLFDRGVGNRSQVVFVAERNWHLGMLGHGALFDGGDRDVAVLGGEGDAPRFESHPDHYRLPAYLDDVAGPGADVARVDDDDGAIDGRWLGRLLEDPAIWRQTPVWTLFQTRLLERLIAEEEVGADDVPDLVLTNYKEIDLAGHVYNMVAPETRAVLRYSDAALARLARVLDERAGKGRWVMAVTADHGQGPDPLGFGAWPIGQTELLHDLGARFDVAPDDLVLSKRPEGYWLDHDVLEAEGITLDAIAAFLLRYTLADNVPEGSEVPGAYRDRASERLFAAAFPTEQMEAVVSCRR